MPDQLDTVAQAIWAAEPKDMGVETRWDRIPEGERQLRRILARAAIDALRLTEEWALRTETGATVLPEDEVRYRARMWPKSYHAASRLVSPWVKAED